MHLAPTFHSQRNKKWFMNFPIHGSIHLEEKWMLGCDFNVLRYLFCWLNKLQTTVSMSIPEFVISTLAIYSITWNSSNLLQTYLNILIKIKSIIDILHMWKLPFWNLVEFVWLYCFRRFFYNFFSFFIPQGASWKNELIIMICHVIFPCVKVFFVCIP